MHPYYLVGVVFLGGLCFWLSPVRVVLRERGHSVYEPLILCIAVGILTWLTASGPLTWPQAIALLLASFFQAAGFAYGVDDYDNWRT